MSVPLEGVPSAPPLTTNAPAEPTLTPRAVTTPVPVVVAATTVVPPPMMSDPLVSVPEAVTSPPPAAVAHSGAVAPALVRRTCSAVPMPRRMLSVPLWKLMSPDVVVGASASNAAVAVVFAVPPLAIGSVPVTPVVSGRPVRFVATPEAGVPKAGVTNVGEVANTSAPDPVSSVTAVARLADEGVPRKVATPAARPLTPVLIGKPVMLVATPLAGVPRAGVTNVGDVPNTSAPEPVSPVTAAARLADDGVARNVSTPVPRPVTAETASVTPVSAPASERMPTEF